MSPKQCIGYNVNKTKYYFNISQHKTKANTFESDLPKILVFLVGVGILKLRTLTGQKSKRSALCGSGLEISR